MLVLREQEQRGFVERVDGSSTTRPMRYLVHHDIKKDSPTTSIRIVYDGSTKWTDDSYSLNNCLYTGPSLVSYLAQVLLRFRCKKKAWVADTEKVFLLFATPPGRQRLY